jgi:hypothetical protein
MTGQENRFPELLPFESWERLDKESSAAFAAFCAYRDYGPERSIRKAVTAAIPDTTKAAKRYRVWRLWSMQFKWLQRAADYDRYLDRLKLAETRKAIESLGKKQSLTAGKILDTVDKKLDSMTPQDLNPGLIAPLMESVGRVQRDLLENEPGKDSRTEPEPKPGEIHFIPEFEGL